MMSLMLLMSDRWMWFIVPRCSGCVALYKLFLMRRNAGSFSERMLVEGRWLRRLTTSKSYSKSNRRIHPDSSNCSFMKKYCVLNHTLISDGPPSRIHRRVSRLRFFEIIVLMFSKYLILFLSFFENALFFCPVQAAYLPVISHYILDPTYPSFVSNKSIAYEKKCGGTIRDELVKNL